MGDRAVISNNTKNLGVYLHWNGYREFVESVLAYCDLKQYRSPDADDEYGWGKAMSSNRKYFGWYTFLRRW